MREFTPLATPPLKMTLPEAPVILLTSSVFQSNPGEHQDLLESAGFTVIRRRGPLPESELLDLVGEVDGILCDPDDITNKVIKKAAPRLKMITKVGAGTASIDVEACKAMGVELFNTSGLTQQAVAEHTIGLTLAVARNIVISAAETQAGMWRKRPGVELSGKNFGIIGCGNVGCGVAKISAALGMNVHAYRRKWPDADVCPGINVEKHNSLETLFSVSDVVSLHAPLTKSTQHMIGASEFAQMKDDTILVNTSRAALIDTNALLDALDSGKLAGYAADVMTCEPPDQDDPILVHPKTVITPHIGGLTRESIPRQLESATRRLLDFFDRAAVAAEP